MTDFDALYRSNPDPWAVRTAWYECRKRAVLMAALPRPTYGMALELGCGTGEATRVLATRCADIRAVDLSPTAIAIARAALAEAGTDHVQLHEMRLPGAWPLAAGAVADLIVVSELAYYFDDADLDVFVMRCRDSLAPDGDWVMCHYTCDFHDRRQSNARLRDAVHALSGLRRVISHDDERFRIDVWRKTTDAQP